MKKIVMLWLAGCLISPVSFAGEEIQLAAAIGGNTSSGAIGAGPSNGGPSTNDTTPENQGNDTDSGISQDMLTKTTVTTLGILVAGAVLAVSGGGGSNSTSHHP
jgi:hypothetical protein